MFEKEAEKYVPNINWHAYSSKEIREEMMVCYRKGAEFGHNKANEWHFVKDELPLVKKEYNGRSELVLVLSKEKEMQYAQYVEKEKTWARGICEINFKPYAWKEIVLPELEENKE